ncbi:hypothetical protein HDU76_002421, partial [Blyttiomyces sp. JEL0837]
YFVFFGYDPFIADFMFRSYSHGLIGPQYVWLGWNFPWPEATYSGNITTYFGPFATDPIQGYITDIPADQSLDAEPIQRYNTSWSKFAAQSPRYIPVTEFGGPDLPMASYDCTNVILYGLDKLLKHNPQFTPEMLANGSLKEYLNYTAFQHTGYNGIQRSPITLNEYGDSEL